MFPYSILYNSVLKPLLSRVEQIGAHIREWKSCSGPGRMSEYNRLKKSPCDLGGGAGSQRLMSLRKTDQITKYIKDKGSKFYH